MFVCIVREFRFLLYINKLGGEIKILCYKTYILHVYICGKRCNFAAKFLIRTYMKQRLLPLFTALFIGSAAFVQAQCPTFSTSPWPNVSYNLNATPWPLELHVFGDTTGAQIQWYRYVRDVQTEADAVPYTGQGGNTVSECYPQTDAAVRNTWYNYYCVIISPSCPDGVQSQTFDVQVANGSDCMTMDGTTFTIQSAPSAYDEGDAITLTAYYSGYGGFHYFTWFFNGDTLREDANHIVYSDPDNFNYTTLTIPACEVSDQGAYSVRVMDGPDCIKYTASAKNITVKPHEYLVFDDNNGTHVWSDPKNWWPTYNRLPSVADSAVVRKACRVDIKNAQVGKLTIDMTGATALTIAPQGALTIAAKLYNCKAGDLLIEADATGNGALVMAPGNNNVPATVQFYALSEQMGSAAPVWQYMGYPMQEKPVLSAAYAGAELYEWTNTPNTAIGGNWQKIDAATKNAEPFTGYCMTESAKHTYTFSGTLHNPATKTLQVPYNDRGDYPGFAFMANSWVAPIDIASLETSDFGAADATVYIMNTGTYAQAKEHYNAIPVHAASYMPGALTVIPPMQGFFVHTNSATTLTMDYNKAVYTPALAGVNTTPTRAPKQIENHKSEIINVESMIRLQISGFGYSDALYILTGDAFTDAFDNGWDGHKAQGRSPLSISAKTSYGLSAVAAMPVQEYIPLQIEGGLDKYYTISFEILNPKSSTLNTLYLFDKDENTYTPITDGAQYTFTFTGDSGRFAIVRTIGQEENPVKAVKYIRDTHLYIEKAGVIYDAIGRKIGIAQ